MRLTGIDEEALTDGIDARIARGEILKLVRRKHVEQKHRMDHVRLWHTLRGIDIPLGEYEVKTYLQDLEVTGLITFTVEEDERLGRRTFVHIMLTAKGLAVVERRLKDDSVIL